MRANTNRRLRFAFDRRPQEYDQGRPSFPWTIVSQVIRKARLSAGSTVLEIGPGTGQLTRGLLQSGLKVVAVEPGERLATTLRQNCPSRRLEIVLQTFEEFCPRQEYDAVVAANSFHWLDPEVSYKKTCTMLKPRGSLVTLWNHPIIADCALQDELNSVVVECGFPDLAREPRRFESYLNELIQAGRAELHERGSFAGNEWTLSRDSLTLTVEEYTNLLSSFAHSVGHEEQLSAAVKNAIGPRKEILMCNYLVLCVART